MLDSISHLVSFVYSAEEGGFSAAARRLGLTPAAVSKNVAALERQLGVRLFRRTTRQLSLTEEGEQFLRDVAEPWQRIEGAVLAARDGAAQPGGTLKVGMAPAVGRSYFVPMLEEFRRRYPGIVLDLHFDNRQVDLVRDGFDAAIGGGIELSEGVIARELAHVRVVAVAAPCYLAARGAPVQPEDLAGHDGVKRRSVQTGRVVAWNLRTDDGREAAFEPRTVVICDDPEAMAAAAVAGMGIALLPLPHVMQFFGSGQLVQVLPAWHTPARPLCVYYPSRRHLPAKTRVFVDFIVEQFRAQGLAEQFRGPAGTSQPKAAS